MAVLCRRIRRSNATLEDMALLDLGEQDNETLASVLRAGGFA